MTIKADQISFCDAGYQKDRLAWQPWSCLNLVRNPFGELSIEERAELAVVDHDLIGKVKLEGHSAIEFIGECGRGKSTRLRWLQSRLHQSSYVYLPEDGPIPAFPAGDPLIIDEAQRLTRPVKRRVFATGIPLILGTHQSLARSLRRWGYQVESIRIGQQNTALLIQEVLNRRIEASRLREGKIPVVSSDDARHLFARFGSDVRSIEGYMYEKFQQRVTEPSVRVDQTIQNC